MSAQIIPLPGARAEPVQQPKRSQKRMRGVGSLHVYRYRRREKASQAQIEALTGALVTLELAASHARNDLKELLAAAR